MSKYNSVVAGIIAGSILPAISLFVFLYLLKGSFLIFNKPGVPYLVATGLNLFIIRYCAKKRLDKTTMGMVLVTFVFMLAIFIFKLQPIR
ncbi:hypothetical protein [Mucilaginibacter sp. SP1R1]|uniref:hypothetical protein n=1 Tax=Mucilaginibacter sp. SP1R1 TaxID=2723091 RepID=UPI001611D340|nr:hypothetical protein [Mucilaginibacter sp. SP1R1]MBB6152142.1 hypothetical protein [Mucilaginibacter sp. SP1R1]